MNAPEDSAASLIDPEVAPPPHLRQRVEHTLSERGLLRSKRPLATWAVWHRPWVTAAAALALVAGSFWLGATIGGAPDVGRDARPPAQPGFVLLLYEDEGFRAPADEEAVVAEYVAWAMQVERNGVPISGEKLGEAGVLLGGPLPDSVPDPVGDGTTLPAGDRGPLGRLAGYFTLATQDRSEAIEIARTCPHLRYGGRIVVRPIEGT